MGIMPPTIKLKMLKALRERIKNRIMVTTVEDMENPEQTEELMNNLSNLLCSVEKDIKELEGKIDATTGNFGTEEKEA